MFWTEWEIPRDASSSWTREVQKIHGDWWQARIARQKAIDKSIAGNAEYEYSTISPTGTIKSRALPGLSLWRVLVRTARWESMKTTS